MKKFTLISFSLFLLIGLFACSNQNEQASNSDDPKTDNIQKQDTIKKDVREVIWGQLSLQQKERIDGTWKEGKVSKVTLNKDMMSQVKDKSYEGKEVYMISFPTDEKSEPNIMTVYANVNTFNYIGDALLL
jgi:hypothetical protein